MLITNLVPSVVLTYSAPSDRGESSMKRDPDLEAAVSGLINLGNLNSYTVSTFTEMFQGLVTSPVFLLCRRPDNMPSWCGRHLCALPEHLMLVPESDNDKVTH